MLVVPVMMVRNTSPNCSIVEMSVLATFLIMSPTSMPALPAPLPSVTETMVTPLGVWLTLTPRNAVGVAVGVLPASRSSSSGLMLSMAMANPMFWASGIPAELIPMR